MPPQLLQPLHSRTGTRLPALLAGLLCFGASPASADVLRVAIVGDYGVDTSVEGAVADLIDSIGRGHDRSALRHQGSSRLELGAACRGQHHDIGIRNLLGRSPVRDGLLAERRRDLRHTARLGLAQDDLLDLVGGGELASCSGAHGPEADDGDAHQES